MLGGSLFNAWRSYAEVRHGQDVVASRVIWARDPFSLGRGLLGTASLTPGRDGCWLVPCRKVHCHGMKYAIDTIHLDRNLVVVGVERVGINEVGSRFPHTHSILELAEGEAERFGIRVHDTLSIRPLPRCSEKAPA